MEEMKLTHATGRATVVVERGIDGDCGGSAPRDGEQAAPGHHFTDNRKKLAEGMQLLAHAESIVKLKRVFELKDKLLDALGSKFLEQEDEQEDEQMADFLEQEELWQWRDEVADQQMADFLEQEELWQWRDEVADQQMADFLEHEELWQWRDAVAAGEEW